MHERIEEIELFAWMGPDDGFPVEACTGEIGIKRGRVPAGDIPLVATQREKIDRPEVNPAMRPGAHAVGGADTTRQPRMLVRFVFAEVRMTIEPDPALGDDPVPVAVPMRGVELP